ncbi:TetR/AcrR family transcriptional regulator [Chitiniphilus purpureus]|uniref:TetR/AcrR family transcriptional regulator n=1 Tax=Chitiniphilus purpureus TaxID=2981137 RepID=A0ABY6DQS9_9NEIS|nr:TetR/AcrR family transcriptional regulator [Chitiniphilus sp. CD1]UXY16672.1 TetR/AcrR family transcriptional regulator [Chitiniphilus sp. CD1]
MATQIERSNQTRTKLIEATVALLVEHGYAALGEQRICKRAGVSRGALRHHYPQGRYDLLPTVVETLLEAESHRLAGLGMISPKDRLYMMLQGFLLHPRQGTSIAILEIWMAARGDTKLAQCTGPAFSGALTRLFGHSLHQPADAEELAVRFLLHGAALHCFSSDYDELRLQEAVRWILQRLPVPTLQPPELMLC